MDYRNNNSIILIIFIVLFAFIFVPAILLIAGATGTMAVEDNSATGHVVGQIDSSYTQATTYSFLEEKQESLLVLAIRNS